MQQAGDHAAAVEIALDERAAMKVQHQRHVLSERRLLSIHAHGHLFARCHRNDGIGEARWQWGVGCRRGGHGVPHIQVELYCSPSYPSMPFLWPHCFQNPNNQGMQRV
ncbi:hypothetical protein SDC9_106688 [bioreactor metagenome]|uniref:Uncharacterized protein n=1 Tax=bioreactor metagenome TaxID=1076179 RepID=A0A645B312_9ZZZZ